MKKDAVNAINYQTLIVPIESIHIPKRIRQNARDVEALAEDIRVNGLINPVAVFPNDDGTYTLVAGLRRLRAYQFLGQESIRATILTTIEAGDMVALEFAENEHRVEFTMAERLEYAEKVSVIEKRRARERCGLYARGGRQNNAEETLGTDEASNNERGKSRDIIARKTGFSSGRQYERLAKIADARPELIEKIDAGEISVREAYYKAFPQPKAGKETEPMAAGHKGEAAEFPVNCKREAVKLPSGLGQGIRIEHASLSCAEADLLAFINGGEPLKLQINVVCAK